ncbi:MAG: hypothetical protein OHK0012_07950 [Synechococcales cyanobacterium]
MTRVWHIANKLWAKDWGESAIGSSVATGFYHAIDTLSPIDQPVRDPWKWL